MGKYRAGLVSGSRNMGKIWQVVADHLIFFLYGNTDLVKRALSATEQMNEDKIWSVWLVGKYYTDYCLSFSLKWLCDHEESDAPYFAVFS